MELLKNLLEDYKKFKDKAEKYVEIGEVDGALINYQLAANSLYNARKIVKKDSTECNTLCLQIKSDDKVQLNEAGETQLKTFCDNICIRIDEELRDILSNIPALQNELKKRKSGFMGPSSKNEDEASCQQVFDKQIIFTPEKDNCLFFDDIIGQQEAKDALLSGLVWPNVYPNLYPKAAKGILFYGPPGTGKTLLAKAAANELNNKDDKLKVLFFAPQGGDLKGKYVGETEKNIAAFFKCAGEAAKTCEERINKKNKVNLSKDELVKYVPTRVISLLFIDEVDAIAGDRSKDDTGMMSLSVNALLQALDGVDSAKNVSVIVATNLPWGLDPAFLRRFENQILIDLPDTVSIKKIIDFEIDKFVTKVEKYVKDQIEKGTVVEYKRKTKKLICPDDPNVKRCEIDSKTVIGKWMKAPYNYYINGDDGNPDLTNSKLGSLAQSMRNANFSASDVSMLCKRVFRNVAERARKNYTFYKMDYSSFVDKGYKNERIAVDVEGGQVPIYLSLMSMTHMSDQELIKCSTSDPIDCLISIGYPPYASITTGKKTKTKFVHKSKISKETFLNAENISDFYINKESLNTNEYKVLFPITIALKSGEEKEKGGQYFIETIITEDQLRSIRNKELGWKYNPLKIFRRKKLTLYEMLINNMIDKGYLYGQNSEGQWKQIWKQEDIKQIKESLLSQVFEISNEYSNLMDYYEKGNFVTDDPNPIGRGTTSPYNYNVEAITIEFEPESRDESDFRDFNNEAFLTFDIRDLDFEDAYRENSKGSVKDIDYKNIKEYKKNPQGFTPEQAPQKGGGEDWKKRVRRSKILGNKF